ncbi:unnamed protein product [Mytilus coruscus]|uniref:Uncharacterized protein n=1 Tax=Mytilus coruscus TaxID=42192 RepID=A0A6J8BQF2_MYTCO|nr:unnamed protein product [Mytilus coruscus]
MTSHITIKVEAFKDLQSFIESKRSIKATEVEDNEKNELQNLKAFVENTDSVHRRYTQILSELENALLEIHDVTYYSSYRSIDSDIQKLVNIPDEPEEAQVPIFKDKFLYREVLEYMDSKIDNSLCPNCSVQKMKIEDLQSENKKFKETLQRDLETKVNELRKLSKDIKSLEDEKLRMQSKDMEWKCEENKNLSREIHSFRGRAPGVLWK